MREHAPLAEPERDAVDHAALRLMLAYIEAECRRLGATDAARHAALAAALVTLPEREPDSLGVSPAPRSVALH